MNLAPKLSEEEYKKNFEELTTAFTQNAAIVEANRCLFCYDSPCTKACPTYIDIPAFIKKISTGNLLGSAKTIFKSNWVALTCAKACPVEDLCEGACVLNENNEKPIEIGRLQRFAIENFFEAGSPKLFSFKSKNGKSVGIIGSGPAGLACGAELSLLGYDVQIYESNKIPGGLNTWGIAPYKTTREDSLKEVELVKSLGVNIQTEVTIGKDITITDLKNKHDAIFIGIGLGESPSLRIPGEILKGVYGALEFIEIVKRENWSSVDVGKRVAVIGAGNTAIDAATEAKRLGAEEVIIVYRRSENEMPANDFEFRLAKNDGIVFHFLTSPVEIIGKDYVEKIKCKKMELGQADSDGRRKPKPIPGSEFEIPVDMIITALGQRARAEFLTNLPDLIIDNGCIVVDSESFQTGNSKVFAGGDCINGGKEVVNAAYDGKRAARGIDNFLSNIIA
ncbi:MAG: NAD(P)-dependent oxidoreductase [Ignavibacteriaceae bacterium]|nr:NAD(P)-dependent oxidoreductase [Ignavibacteriaceae bacterium]